MDNILSTLKITIDTVNQSELDSTWQSKSSVSPATRLYYILDGSGFIEHHDRRYDLVPGHLYLIPGNSAFAYKCPDRIEIFWSHFTAEILSSISLFDYLSCRYELTPAFTSHVHTKLSQLKQVYRRNEPNAQLMSQGLILELIAPFFNTETDQDHLKHQQDILRFEAILDYIDKHLNQAISITELARKAGLERAYFSTAFAKVFNCSPKAFINTKRIEKAQYLLMNSTLKLEAIAQDLGFNDAFHFSKTFKKVIGLSPSEYRKKKTILQP